MDSIPIRHLFVAYLVVVAFAIFGWTCSRLAQVMFKGRPFPGGFRELARRAADVLVYFFGQRSVAREASSRHHLLIFWGFLVITVGTLEIITTGIFGKYGSYAFLLGQGFDSVFKLLLDVTNGVVLLVVCYSFFRRLVIKPRLIPISTDAAVILGMIGLLCLSHFISHGFHHAANVGLTDARLMHPAPGAPGPIEHMPVSAMFAAIGAGLSSDSAQFWSEVNYWLHLGIVLVFLNYIPYSKHIHLLGALPNIALRNRGQRGIMPKLDLEDESQWGAGTYEQFDWKSLLDTYACTECARCSNNCPAYNTGKPLSPMHLIHDIRYEMLERGGHLIKLSPNVHPTGETEGGHDEPTTSDREVIDRIAKMQPLVGGRIKEDTLWACTTCGACEEVCPVFIEHPAKIIQMRTHLVLAEGRMPAELARMYRGMENNQNPWGMGSDKRMEWAEGRDVPTMADKGEAEYLVWIGCAGAFDDRAQKITHAWLDLLDHAGVDYAILGEEETCTGDAARRSGNEFLFQMMAESNVETMNGYKVKKVLTACPHCLHTIRHEYPQFGGNYEVQHHSEFLKQLVDQGKLKPDSKLSEAMTYHDACYLGRWNKTYEAPRELLGKANGAALTEMPRTREKSFCCGAGGGHMFMEEEGERVNYNRTNEAIATGVRTIATACPFCNVMLTDGVKSADKEEDVRVLDIAEVLAQTIGGVARKKQTPQAAAEDADPPAAGQAAS